MFIAYYDKDLGILEPVSKALKAGKIAVIAKLGSEDLRVQSGF
jgi:hypothetical protein